MDTTARCDNCDLETRRAVPLVATTPTGRRIPLVACPECRLQLVGDLLATPRIRRHGPALDRRKAESSEVGEMRRRVDPVLTEMRVKRWLGLERFPPLTVAELAERWGLEAEACARALRELNRRGEVALTVHAGGRYEVRVLAS